MNKNKLRKALREDFHELYVKKYSTGWKDHRLIRDIEIGIMQLDNMEKLLEKEKEKSYEIGFDNGQDRGYDVGYNEGYSDCIKKLSKFCNEDELSKLSNKDNERLEEGI